MSEILGLWRAECPTCDHSPCPSDSACPFPTVWNQIELGIIIVDNAAAKLISCNYAATRLLEKLGEPVSYHLVSRRFLTDHSQPPLAKFSSPAELRLASGEIIGYTIHPAGVNSVCVILNDVTEKVRLQSIAQADNLMKNLGFVFAGIRHELGNPVHAIKMNVSVMQRDLEQLPTEKISKKLEQLASDVLRIEFLLTSLRTFSMYEDMTVEPVCVATFLEEFINLARASLSACDVAASIEVDPNVKCVLADRRSLQQILLNLLGNSLDSLEGRTRKSLRIIATPRDGLVQLSIEDSGCGMTEEQLANLFRPFVTNKRGGTGLGLVIVRKMMTLMLGEIQVQSRLGRGTTVTLTLPQCVGKAPGESQ